MTLDGADLCIEDSRVGDIHRRGRKAIRRTTIQRYGLEAPVGSDKLTTSCDSTAQLVSCDKYSSQSPVIDCRLRGAWAMVNLCAPHLSCPDTLFRQLHPADSASLNLLNMRLRSRLGCADAPENLIPSKKKGWFGTNKVDEGDDPAPDFFV